MEGPLNKEGIEFKLFDCLRQPEEPEIKMEDWDEFITNKVDSKKALMVIVYKYTN